MVKAHDTTGVKCFSVAGRMADRLERCKGMTDEERRWRAQWLKDQILSPDEPRFVPEYFKETNNFFRRLYKVPMNKLQMCLTPTLGPTRAFYVRHFTGRIFISLALLYTVTYILKYHSNDFVPRRTIEIYFNRPVMYPDHPDYPNYPVAVKPSDYYDQGFYSSLLCQDVSVEDVPLPSVPSTVQKEAVVCPALDFVPRRTIEIYFDRPVMYPDHPDYPNYPVAVKPSDYYDQGFHSSVLAKDIHTEKKNFFS